MERLNPWRQVPLEVYEGHMGWDSVCQLQALNAAIKAQLAAYPTAKTAAILRVAGGNGLEHCGRHLEKIYGIDINPAYLEACRQRFQESLGPRLELWQLDLAQPQAQLPRMDLLIADLLIEYIGIDIFCRKSAASQARQVSCVIQLPGKDFVSDSPYRAGLQAVGGLHQDICPECLRQEFAKYGYVQAYREKIQLPNGKELLRVDYEICPEKGG